MLAISKHRPRFSLQKISQFFRVDKPLLIGLLSLVCIGLIILYSASNQNLVIIGKQALRMIIAFSAMLMLAQISPSVYRAWAPWVFIFSFGLLLAVLILGVVGKGAQRWLNLGLLKFQPSELMKLSVPMMLAWYLHDKSLPPSFFDLFIALIIIAVPTLLVIKQPDLGTALLIVASGFSVILLSGVSGRWLLLGGLLMLIIAPLGWHFMHEYQKLRVLTFLNPERDPLGAGYHIIQ
jgi:rod shape determining protein RodA